MADLKNIQDQDPEETREWLESIDSVIRTGGGDRAHFLLERLIDHARRSGAYLPFKPNTAYVNTIPTSQEPSYPGDRALEKRLEAYMRWKSRVAFDVAEPLSARAASRANSSGVKICRQCSWPFAITSPAASSSRNLAGSTKRPFSSRRGV